MQQQVKQKLNLFSILKQKFKLYRDKKRAFIIGQRAALGKNIYLTFGSEKSSPKSAEDSFELYAMAMKHYNETVCDKESLLAGFNKAIVKKSQNFKNNIC